MKHFMRCCRESCEKSHTTIGQPVDPPGCLPTGEVKARSDPLHALELAKMPRRRDGSVVSIKCLLNIHRFTNMLGGMGIEIVFF